LLGGFITSRKGFEAPKELFDDLEHWANDEILKEHGIEIDTNATNGIQTMRNPGNDSLQD
jgi:hypothetical protein